MKNQLVQAAVFNEPNQPLELTEFQWPILQESQVMVRITCCTICGSDLHSFLGHRSTPLPTILGHEIIGEVVELGPGKVITDYHQQPLNIGDRVTWSIAASCNDCFYCDQKLPQKCESLLKYGHLEIDDQKVLTGGFAEYCHLQKGTAIFRLPDDLPDEVAAPANCATATVTATFRTAPDCRDQTVLIQGAGMLGLTATAMAASLGAAEIIVADPTQSRLKLAAKFGATSTVLIQYQSTMLNDTPLYNTIMQKTSGRGVDLAIDMSGNIGAIKSGLELLRIGGSYLLVGAVFPTDDLSIQPEMIVRKMLNIHGVHNYRPDDLSMAIKFLSNYGKQYPFEMLIGRSFPLTQINVALQHAIQSDSMRIAVKP